MAKAKPKPKEGLPEFHPVGEDVLDQLAVDLANVLRIKTLEADLEAGKMILDSCYQGSLPLFSAYNTGDESMEKVAERMPRLGYPVSAVQLTRYVKMYEQELAFGPLSRWRNLTLSHLWLVQHLGLEDQPAVLQNADDKALSIEQLAKILGAKEKKPRSEPTAIDEVYRAVGRILDAVGEHDDWWIELRQAHLIEDDIELFDGIFDRVTVELETAVLALADRGAHVPVSRQDAFRKHLEDFAERMKKAADQVTGKASP